MDVLNLIHRARTCGLSLSVVDGKLKAAGKPTDEVKLLAAEIKAHKDEIITLLQTTLQSTATKPPLPAELWVTGIATFAEARKVQRSFTGRYVTHCGRGEAGFYVAGPNSGLCAVVTHTAIADVDRNEDEFSLTFEAVQP